MTLVCRVIRGNVHSSSLKILFQRRFMNSGECSSSMIPIVLFNYTPSPMWVRCCWWEASFERLDSVLTEMSDLLSSWLREHDEDRLDNPVEIGSERIDPRKNDHQGILFDRHAWSLVEEHLSFRISSSDQHERWIREWILYADNVNTQSLRFHRTYQQTTTYHQSRSIHHCSLRVGASVVRGTSEDRLGL